MALEPALGESRIEPHSMQRGLNRRILSFAKSQFTAWQSSQIYFKSSFHGYCPILKNHSSILHQRYHQFNTSIFFTAPHFSYFVVLQGTTMLQLQLHFFRATATNNFYSSNSIRVNNLRCCSCVALSICCNWAGGQQRPIGGC